MASTPQPPPSPQVSSDQQVSQETTINLKDFREIEEEFTPPTIQDSSPSNDHIWKNPPEWIKNNMILSHLLSKERLFAIIFSGLFVFIICWLYIGAYWNPSERSANLEVVLLNLDQGFNWSVLPSNVTDDLSTIPSVGSLFEDYIQNKGNNLFDWKILNPNSTTHEQISDMILHAEAWLGIIIPANFSQSFITAGRRHLAQNTSNETLAKYISEKVFFQYIKDSGRNPTTVSIIDSIAQGAIASFSVDCFRTLLTHNVSTTNDLVTYLNPLVFSEGFQLKIIDLHIVIHSGQGLSALISLLMLWIGAMFGVVAMGKVTDSKPPKFHILGTYYNADHKDFPNFTLTRLLWVRFLLGAFICLFQSLLIAIIPLILGATYYSNFFLAWMWLFYSQLTFLTILGAISNLLGYDGVSFPSLILMVLQFVSCDGAVTVQLMPSFFHVGVAFPMYYAVRGLRSIYFGSLSDAYHIAVNCCVIFAWFLPSLICTLFFYRQRLVQNPVPAWAVPYWTKPDQA